MIRTPHSRSAAALATLTILVGVLLSGFGSAPRAAQNQPPPANGPQAPRPTFRSNVEAVQLDLRVVDRKGAFVSDLRREEFRIFEDGVEQRISNFALIDIPVEPPSLPGLDGPRADPDVATNGQKEGRLYVIVMDDLETGEPERVDSPETQGARFRSSTVRALAREFIEKSLSDDDRVAVVTMSGRRDMAQDFTSNRQRLIDIVSRYEGGYGQVMMASQGAGGGFATPGGGFVNDNQRSKMLSLTSIAKWLTQIDGRRKAIVLFSDRLGRSLSGTIDLTLATGEGADIQDFLQAASRGNVSLYTIDPVGVPTGAAAGVRPPFVDDGAAFDAGRQQSLITLSEATGGFAATRANNFTQSFARIVSENSSYYLLGYVSTNQKKDGKFRNIDVRVRRPDVRIQARSGYVAPKDTKAPAANGSGNLPPAISDMLKSPLAVSGLPLSVAVPVMRGNSGSKAAVGVVVEAGANRLLFTSGNGRANGGITLAIAAADMGGKLQAGERGALNFRLSPQTREAMLERGSRVISQLELKPGRYQVKVAAIDTADGTTRGSVLYDLDVPDFSKGPLTMSNVVLSSMTEAPVPTVARDPRLRQTFGNTPTARRSFTRFEELRAYVEVYDNDKHTSHPVVLTNTVMNASGREVFRREVNSQGASNQDKTSTHRVTTTIPLNDLPPGRYVLQMQAHTTASATVQASRDLPFTVR